MGGSRYRRGLSVLLGVVFLSPIYAQTTFRPPIFDVQSQRKSTALLRLGSFRLHGVLGIHTTYDSNALFEDSGGQPDMILSYIPGLDLLRESERLRLMASYRYRFRDNVSFSVQDYQSHNALAEADWAFARRFNLLIRNEFEKTADAADVELPERIGRWTNRAQLEIRHKTPGEDLETRLTYINTLQRFDTSFQDVGFFQNKLVLNSRVNVNSSFRFLPKSVVSASVEYGDTRFENNPPTSGTAVPAQNQDSHGVSGTLGLSSVLSRKVTYSLSGGYAYLTFDGGEDTHQMTGALTLNYNPSSRLVTNVGYARGVRVSTFTNYYGEHQVTADITYRAMSRLRVFSRHRLSFIGFSGPNVTFTGVTRNDTLYQGMLGGTFMWTPFLSSSLDYTAVLRDSNAVASNTPTQTASFLKHLVTLSLDLYY